MGLSYMLSLWNVSQQGSMHTTKEKKKEKKSAVVTSNHMLPNHQKWLVVSVIWYSLVDYTVASG